MKMWKEKKKKKHIGMISYAILISVMIDRKVMISLNVLSMHSNCTAITFSIIEFIRIFYLTLHFCTKYERRKPGDDWFKFK